MQIHANPAAHATALTGKLGPPPPWRRAEDIPVLARLKPAGCLHCHNVFDGHRFERKRKNPQAPAIRYPYPPPQNLGLRLDPDDPCRIVSVAAGSAAATAGLREGDRLRQLGGQLVLSIADVGWVLHLAPDAGTIACRDQRGDRVQRTSLRLTPGWRKSDLSWRPSADEWEELLEKQ